jgi:hypothetical protein
MVTDSADGIFLNSTYPNDPASGPAFATEGNVDAKCPQESLRATQPTSERAGILGQPYGPAQLPLMLRPALGHHSRTRAASGSTSIMYRYQLSETLSRFRPATAWQAVNTGRRLTEAGRIGLRIRCR